MPVWHEQTKALRKSGKLKVIGITQEQHPDRCLLFARWRGFDWPILWDPFNMTGTRAVPRVTLIDEHGVVRGLRANPTTLQENFLGKSFPKPAATKALPKADDDELIEATLAAKGSAEKHYYDALSTLLWPAGRDNEKALHALSEYAKAHPKDAAAQWRLGVAYRMRYDSLERSEGDFQHAVDQWQRGLDLNPAQYIYRRRIQQYGPRLTKPYPFYPWIAAARKALGDKAPALVAEPSGSEVAGQGGLEATSVKIPDVRGAETKIKDGLEIETTVVWHTARDGRSAARVHVQVRPAGRRVLLWDAEAGPVTLWVEPSEGFEIASNRIDKKLVGKDKAEEVVEFDFEVHPPGGKIAAFDLGGYVLYYACLDTSGTCKYLRQDLDLSVPARSRR